MVVNDPHKNQYMSTNKKITIIKNKNSNPKQSSKSKVKKNRKNRNRRGGETMVGVSVKTNSVNKAPKFQRLNDGGVIVEHREFLGNFMTHSTAHMTRYDVNPGDDSTFPWLSTIASGYEKFQVMSMSVQYKPTCSTITNGQFMGYVEYDVEDELQADPKTVLNMFESVSGNLWSPHTLSVKSSKFNQAKSYLIRTKYTQYGTKLLYDPCSIMIGSDADFTGITGQIWISYKIRLLVPSTDNQVLCRNSFFTLSEVHMYENATGSIVPDLTTGTQNKLAGNFFPRPTALGWKFDTDFCGMLHILIETAGDINPETATVYCRAITGPAYTLFTPFLCHQGSALSSERFSFAAGFRILAGSYLSFSGDWGTSGYNGNFYVSFYECDVKYWDAVAVPRSSSLLLHEVEEQEVKREEPPKIPVGSVNKQKAPTNLGPSTTLRVGGR